MIRELHVLLRGLLFRANNIHKNYSMRTGSLLTGLIDFCEYIDVKDAIGVEIGTYMGDGASVLARSGKFSKLYTVDPWIPLYDPKDGGSFDWPMSIVKSEYKVRTAAFPCVSHLELTSEKAAGLFDSSSLDFVYIDGDHRYASVKEDVKRWLPKVKKGGYFCGHDYGKSGHDGVKIAVDEILGKPHKTFSDTSWLFRA